MKKLAWAAALLALGVVAGVPSGARADTMYTLGTGGTLPPGNYGSVDVKTVSGNSNELEVVVTLSGTNHFASTGFDASFAFSLAGFGPITVTGLPILSFTHAGWWLEKTTAGSVHMTRCRDLPIWPGILVVLSSRQVQHRWQQSRLLYPCDGYWE